MSSIQDEILEKFYSTLKKSDNFDDERVEQLRVLFDGEKKPKPAEVIRVFSEDAKEGQP
jgi:CMP-2-keto-3-deoxyoctulosonic acid synthetase